MVVWFIHIWQSDVGEDDSSMIIWSGSRCVVPMWGGTVAGGFISALNPRENRVMPPRASALLIFFIGIGSLELAVSEPAFYRNDSYPDVCSWLKIFCHTLFSSSLNLDTWSVSRLCPISL